MKFLAALLFSLLVPFSSSYADLENVEPNQFRDLSTGRLWFDTDVFSGMTYLEIVSVLRGTRYRIATTTEVQALLDGLVTTEGQTVNQVSAFTGGSYRPTTCCNELSAWYDDSSTGTFIPQFGVAGIFTNIGFNMTSFSVTDDAAVFSSSNANRGAWVVERDDIGMLAPNPHTQDLDFDGISDKIVWREATGTWFARYSTSSSSLAAQWGLPGDRPIFGDFDGDVAGDLAVWRPSNGTWYVLLSSRLFRLGEPLVQQFGLPGDVPLRADYDNDGKLDFAVWRPSNGNYYYLRSSDGTLVVDQWGLPGDIPLAGAPRN